MPRKSIINLWDVRIVVFPNSVAIQSNAWIAWSNMRKHQSKRSRNKLKKSRVFPKIQNRRKKKSNSNSSPSENKNSLNKANHFRKTFYSHKRNSIIRTQQNALLFVLIWVVVCAFPIHQNTRKWINNLSVRSLDRRISSSFQGLAKKS